MKLEACGITDIGCVRTNNEDNLVCLPDQGFFAVCDGMGGHAAGEVASAMACQMLAERTQALARSHLAKGFVFTPHLGHHLAQAMTQAMTELSESIADAGQHRTGQKGMGTTCTALWFIDHSHALVAHIGDSRLYLHSDAGRGIVTHDHTLVEELVARGLLGTAEAKRHPQSHILSRALGASSGLSADCFVIRVDQNDRFLLCSDGLHAYLPDQVDLFVGTRRGQVPASYRPPLQEVMQGYIDSAKNQGGHDNLTGVLVHVAGEPQTPAHLPLASLMACLKAHPALEAVPELLLRRLAAVAVVLNLSPAAPGHPGLPNAGIIAVVRGLVTLTDSAGRRTQLGPNDHWSPQPLGAASQEVAALTAATDSQLVYVAAPALQEACDSHPPLGASIMHGLLTETLGG